MPPEPSRRTRRYGPKLPTPEPFAVCSISAAASTTQVLRLSLGRIETQQGLDLIPNARCQRPLCENFFPLSRSEGWEFLEELTHQLIHDSPSLTVERPFRVGGARKRCAVASCPSTATIPGDVRPYPMPTRADGPGDKDRQSVGRCSIVPRHLLRWLRGLVAASPRRSARGVSRMCRSHPQHCRWQLRIQRVRGVYRLPVNPTRSVPPD